MDQNWYTVIIQHRYNKTCSFWSDHKVKFNKTLKLLLFSKSHQSESHNTPLAPVQDADRDEKNLPLIHQQVNADNLAEAEGLLKDLFMDVDKSKKLQHPQAVEIEKEWVYRGASQIEWHSQTHLKLNVLHTNEIYRFHIPF